MYLLYYTGEYLGFATRAVSQSAAAVWAPSRQRGSWAFWRVLVSGGLPNTHGGFVAQSGRDSAMAGLLRPGRHGRSCGRTRRSQPPRPCGVTGGVTANPIYYSAHYTGHGTEAGSTGSPGLPSFHDRACGDVDAIERRKGAGLPRHRGADHGLGGGDRGLPCSQPARGQWMRPVRGRLCRALGLLLDGRRAAPPDPAGADNTRLMAELRQEEALRQRWGALRPDGPSMRTRGRT